MKKETLLEQIAQIKASLETGEINPLPLITNPVGGETPEQNNARIIKEFDDKYKKDCHAIEEFYKGKCETLIYLIENYLKDPE